MKTDFFYFSCIYGKSRFNKTFSIDLWPRRLEIRQVQRDTLIYYNYYNGSL